MTDFKIGRHCMGMAREHFDKKFKGAGTGALELAFVEIGMEGFHIGFQGKTELYKALAIVAHSGNFECLDDDSWDIVNDALAIARGEKS